MAAVNDPDKSGVSCNYIDNALNLNGRKSLTCLPNPVLYPDTIPQIDLGNDTILCNGQSLTYDFSNPNISYIWNGDPVSEIIHINNPGDFTIKAEGGTCIAYDAIEIKSCCDIGNIPNLITPNLDGDNDYFEIQCAENHEVSLEIFNRWGSKIYTNKKYQNEWDGKEVEDAIYYYSIKLQNIEYTGWVELRR